jgi:hypothetical protein
LEKESPSQSATILEHFFKIKTSKTRRLHIENQICRVKPKKRDSKAGLEDSSQKPGAPVVL